jgi:hypothetical protein
LSKLNGNTNLSTTYNQPALQAILRNIEGQVNATSEGKIIGAYNARTSAPTTGNYAQGDFVRNSTPAEAGSGGSKYVVLGWICVASGTPGTWLPCRCLTGD